MSLLAAVGIQPSKGFSAAEAVASAAITGSANLISDFMTSENVGG